jgi:membrane dipeptidase
MSQSRENAGFHSIIDEDHQFTFIDSCMQAWPDAAWDLADQHGVSVYGVTAWHPHSGVTEAMEDLMQWHLVARQHENLTTITSTEDIRNAEEQGKAGILISSQDGAFIENKLHRIEAFYRMGLRTMIPTYNRNNNICGGCLDAEDSGLTYFGRKVVEECNRVGLLLDCTHLAEQSSLDIIEHSSDPVIFSHSNSEEISPNPRNISDEQIEACAENGGVVGLVPFGPFTIKSGQTEWPTVDDYIDHIDHVVEVAGSTDHIGIGTDMSLGTYPDEAHPERGEDSWGEPDYPSADGTYDEHISGNVRSPKRYLQEFNDYAEVHNLIEGLHERGYSEDDVEKFLGGNYMRIFEEVWE